MPVSQLYHTWFLYVRKLLPKERITRVRNLTWFLVGLHQSQSVHLSHIARGLPLRATIPSIVQRFRRFLMNRAFRVRQWYRPVAQQLLTQAAVHGLVRLIIDSTKVGEGHQLLMVALAYRKRALPIAWTWIRGARGHSSDFKQRALLGYVHSLMPEGAAVQLVGDGEFGDVPVLQPLDRWGWKYALRQKSNTLVCISKRALRWVQLGSLVPRKDQPFFYTHAILTKKHLYHTHLLTYWETGEKDPWLLATNMSSARDALKAYRRRMWLDETYGDLKAHGVNLEATKLRHASRLSRLVFAVVLLYLWLVTRGSQAIKNGQRYQVDRRDRRDLCIFRIGLYLIKRLCACGRNFSIRLIPYF
jgi:hypothetical protein